MFPLKKSAGSSQYSDTTSVTPDGAVEVNTEKLFAKQHIKDMMRDMRQKTRVVVVNKTDEPKAASSTPK
jgi:hypothetical protein